MKLVVFDVDGTLVDSQHHIHGAMTRALEFAGLEPVPRPRILGTVGLSLPAAIAQIAPEADAPTQARILGVLQGRLFPGAHGAGCPTVCRCKGLSRDPGGAR